MFPNLANQESTVYKVAHARLPNAPQDGHNVYFEDVLADLNNEDSLHASEVTDALLEL